MLETDTSYQPVQQTLAIKLNNSKCFKDLVQQTWVIQLNNSTIGLFQPVQLKHRFNQFYELKATM